ncbi:MAG TPA: hypothetical protein VFI23_00475 [Rhizomicrobium sp.]|nr:hypothetical protein [Rhizomicrobium sp.]
MIRYAALFALLLWPAFAQAQAADPIINVYFEPVKGSADLDLLTKAIQTAFSQPPLQLAAKPFPGVVVVTVDGKVDVAHWPVSGTTFGFSVAFTRDGTKLGESAQSCNANMLTDCTDQMVQDVKSVSGRHP